jgi:hypothetical protein
VGTKFSAVPYIGLSLIALALTHWLLTPHPTATARARARRMRAAELLVVALAALVPLFIAYGIRTPSETRVAARFAWALSYLLQQHGVEHVFGVVLSHLWLPRELKDLLNGIVAVEAHNDGGHLSFLLGDIRMTGWWYFYLVALAVKTPLPLLAGGSVGVAWIAREGWRSRDTWRLTPALMIIAILVFASAFSHINIGIRHVLILYPLLAIGGAWLVTRSWQALHRMPDRRKAAVGTEVEAELFTPAMQQLAGTASGSVDNDTLLETIISLGQKLGMTMLGEGIETRAQLERLRLPGCELGQGFLFSAAVPAGKVPALLARRPRGWPKK